MTMDVKALPERDLTLMYISSNMSNKKNKGHSTDGLKGLCIFFDGQFANPNLSKMKPYIFTFGARIFNVLDQRINCVVLGRNPSLSKRELSKFPNLKIMDYQTFIETYFSPNNYV